MLSNLNKKFSIFVDQEKSNNILNLLYEYFNVNNIVFDFIPHELPKVPLIDQLMYKLDPKKKVLLIVNFWTLQKLIEQQSSFSNLQNLIKTGKIVLIYFKTFDSHLSFFHGNQTKTIMSLENTNFIWWGDMFFGKTVQKKFKNAKLIEMHHPFIYIQNIHHYFNMLDLKAQKDKTFFSLIRLQPDNKREHRQLLLNKILNENFSKDALLKITHNGREPKLDELNGIYGVIHLQQQKYIRQLPVLPYYERTCFELVCETFGDTSDDESFFLTEKTLKPIMMEHPFMVLSSRNFLKNLRRLGFKTFGEFIDESYDDCDNLADRVQIILQNIKKLDLQSSKDFYIKTKEIRQFNREHLIKLYGEYKFKLWRNLNCFFQNI